MVRSSGCGPLLLICTPSAVTNEFYSCSSFSMSFLIYVVAYFVREDREGIILYVRCCMLVSILGEIIAFWWIPLDMFLVHVNWFPVKILEMLTNDATCIPRIFQRDIFHVRNSDFCPACLMGVYLFLFRGPLKNIATSFFGDTFTVLELKVLSIVFTTKGVVSCCFPPVNHITNSSILNPQMIATNYCY